MCLPLLVVCGNPQILTNFVESGIVYILNKRKWGYYDSVRKNKKR